MAIRGAKERLQRLFEKISDDFVGTCEQDKLVDEHMDLTFLGEDGVVRSSVRLREYLNSTGIPLVVICRKNAAGKLIKDDWVYVSDLPSAVIAICCR